MCKFFRLHCRIYALTNYKLSQHSQQRSNLMKIMEIGQYLDFFRYLEPGKMVCDWTKNNMCFCIAFEVLMLSQRRL